ncbi:MAG: enoyl-CoA hydratase/isomerase family protein [Bacteroidales bacterium]|nr:enoyl-CoA hydratase/isomerase family protein [Bacteroidales bacterium]MBN2758636.1 enoyl-CoA hydratase/isomerase family protein [Bacteroidales bacterium]
MSDQNKSFLTLTIEDNIAIVKMDKPNSEYNIISTDLVDEFNLVLDKIENNRDIKAAILISGKKDFMAGADINSFLKMEENQAKEAAMEGHKLLLRIQNSEKPFIAAIHGACMGGGTEISLACHGRVAANDSKTIMGLPEVKLGVLPGMGGTQRLPRLIGIQSALDIMLTGKNIYSGKALQTGLVDITVNREKLLIAAKKHAKNILSKKFKRKDKRKLFVKFLETFPITKSIIFNKATEIVKRQTYGNYPAPIKIIESVKYGLKNGLTKGIDNETTLFQELLFTNTSRQLINIFLGMTSLKKNPYQDKVKKVENIAIIGAGLMGEGIAELSLQKDFNIILKDISNEMIEKAKRNIRNAINKKVKFKAISNTDADILMNKIHAQTDFTGFKKTDMIIEAVFEDINIKHQLIKEIEPEIMENTIFATNTSALPITEIAKAHSKPENVIGMHYFSPVPKMPLLEIIVHDKTADWVRATTLDVGIKQGKTCIIVKDGSGFYTTRILAPFLNEALLLMEEGVNPLFIDKAMKKFGFPVGPITLIDEVGIDVGAHVTSGKLGEFFEKRGAKSSKVLKEMNEKGFKGRKNKKGFFIYDEKTGKKLRGKINPEIYNFFPKKYSSISENEIQERMSMMMINEAVRCFDEGIIEKPLDGDIGAIFGLGFPPFLGGPFRHIDFKGIDNVKNILDSLQKKYGVRFKASAIFESQKEKFYNN